MGARSRRIQHGAVLVASLVFLLILTLIGIIGMQVTSLEESMTGNMRDRNLAFEAAESALRAGEDFLTAAGLPLFDGSNGLYQPTTSAPYRWETINWGSDSAVKIFANGTSLADLAASPRYIIEELPSVPESGASLEAGLGSSSRYYRVTARGVGGTTNAVVMLQSTYKR